MIITASPFQLERQMVDYLRRGIATPLQLHNEAYVSVVREPSIGNVIPDLLVGVWKQNPTGMKRGRFTHLECHVLALLERHGTNSVAGIAKQLWFSEEEAGRIVRRLLSRNAIVQEDDGLVGISARGRTDSIEVIAIEAKLQRWKEALAQAESYLHFSDQAYVVLDGNQVRITPAVAAAFKNSPVGLILQWGFVLQVVSPAATITSTPSADRVRAIDKLWSARSWKPAVPTHIRQPSSIAQRP